MKINYKIVSAVLATVWTYDSIVAMENRSRHKKLIEKLRREQQKTSYLAWKLDEYHVPTDEFDKIISGYFK